MRETGFQGTDDASGCMFEQAGRQTVATPFGRWMATAPEQQRKEARRANPELDRNWDARYGDRMIKLVFIGRHMDEKAISSALDACLISD